VSRADETAAARVLAVLRAWEHSPARGWTAGGWTAGGWTAGGWTAGGSWALIRRDEGFDPAATDAADPEDQDLVAVVADGRRCAARSRAIRPVTRGVTHAIVQALTHDWPRYHARRRASSCPPKAAVRVVCCTDDLNGQHRDGGPTEGLPAAGWWRWT